MKNVVILEGKNVQSGLNLFLRKVSGRWGEMSQRPWDWTVVIFGFVLGRVWRSGNTGSAGIKMENKDVKNSSSLPVVDVWSRKPLDWIRVGSQVRQVNEQVVETIRPMNEDGQVRRINQVEQKSGVDSNWTVRWISTDRTSSLIYDFENKSRTMAPLCCTRSILLLLDPHVRSWR